MKTCFIIDRNKDKLMVFNAVNFYLNKVAKRKSNTVINCDNEMLSKLPQERRQSLNLDTSSFIK